MIATQFIEDRQLVITVENKVALIHGLDILPRGAGWFSQRNPLVARKALIQSQPNPTLRELGGELLLLGNP
jgi:hypothetical protein